MFQSSLESVQREQDKGPALRDGEVRRFIDDLRRAIHVELGNGSLAVPNNLDLAHSDPLRHTDPLSELTNSASASSKHSSESQLFIPASNGTMTAADLQIAPSGKSTTSDSQGTQTEGNTASDSQTTQTGGNSNLDSSVTPSAGNTAPSDSLTAQPGTIGAPSASDSGANAPGSSAGAPVDLNQSITRALSTIENDLTQLIQGLETLNEALQATGTGGGSANQGSGDSGSSCGGEGTVSGAPAPSENPPVTAGGPTDGNTGTGGDVITPTNNTALPEVPANAFNVANFGARGDGSTDDTAAIQAALDQAAKNGGGAVYVPPGTYMISSSTDGKGGLQLPSNVQLFMTPNTVLESEASDSPSGQIINIDGATNSAVYGGVLNGNESGASANDPEYNHGIRIGGASSNITIQGVTSENNTGDGFYVAVSGQSDITFNGDISDGNGRNGLSVTSFSGDMEIENSTFENIKSTGIDVEPNPGNTTTGIHIDNNIIKDNGYGGLSFGAEGGSGSASNYGNEVSGNTFSGMANGHNIYIGLGPQTITDNNVESADAIIDDSGADNTITGNMVNGQTID
jgi:hypothetical protein